MTYYGEGNRDKNHAAYWHERIAYHSKQIEKCERELRALNNRVKKEE